MANSRSRRRDEISRRSLPDSDLWNTWTSTPIEETTFARVWGAQPQRGVRGRSPLTAVEYYDQQSQVLNAPVRVDRLRQTMPNLVYPVASVASVASNLSVCQRRSERVEVMHALGHAGKGGQKPPVWPKKRIVCK